VPLCLVLIEATTNNGQPDYGARIKLTQCVSLSRVSGSSVTSFGTACVGPEREAVLGSPRPAVLLGEGVRDGWAFHKPELDQNLSQRCAARSLLVECKHERQVTFLNTGAPGTPFSRAVSYECAADPGFGVSQSSSREARTMLPGSAV